MLNGASRASEHILLVGDSIAFRWPERHRDLALRQSSFNFGVSGDRTENVLYRFDKVDFSRTRFDAAIVIVGTNNTSVNTAVEIYAGIVEVVGRIRSMTTAKAIRVVSVLPRGKFLEGRRAKIEAVNQLLRQGQADGGYKFVDAYSDFLARCRGEENCHLLKDGLHPNVAGYDLLAEKILDNF
jgi:lysophospholipase L1-like esterase